MKKNILIYLSLFLFTCSAVYSQNSDSTERKCFIGSSLFVLANLSSDSPQFYQLNIGYRLTSKDVISIEAITWTYKGPLGRSYGSDFDNDESNFPGKVQAFGAGLAYKRFLWKRAYAQIHFTALHQNYLDLSNNKIQSGFQLFNSIRLGYQFRFFKNRIFIEPSIAWTSWPINTNLPDSFQVQEDRFPNNFFGEPGLHFGFNF